MYVSAIGIEGLKSAHGFSAKGLERVVQLAPGPEGIGVADALTLFSAAFSTPRLHSALELLGITDEAELVDEHGVPVQATWADPAGVGQVVSLDHTRHVVITVEVELDPPLFGRLRELAVRDPRLVQAIGAAPTLAAKVGFLFSTDLTALSVGLLRVTVGGVGFPTTADRPAWVMPMLCDIAGRFHRPDWTRPSGAIAAAMLDAALAADPGRRKRFAAARAAVAEPPFGLGALELVRAGSVRACFGPDLVEARQLGPAASEALRLVEAVHLQCPDVLVVEAPGAGLDAAAVVDWLSARTRGDDAVLEQVLVAPGGRG